MTTALVPPDRDYVFSGGGIITGANINDNDVIRKTYILFSDGLVMRSPESIPLD